MSSDPTTYVSTEGVGEGSGSGTGTGGINNKNNTSVFDDYDFSQVKTRRERAKIAKEQNKDDMEKQLLQYMDTTGTGTGADTATLSTLSTTGVGYNNTTGGGAAAVAVPGGSNSSNIGVYDPSTTIGGKKVRRPNLVLIKSKTTTIGNNDPTTSTTQQQQRKKNFFGFGKDSYSTVGSSSDYNNNNNNTSTNYHNNAENVIYERTMIDMTPISIGNNYKTITVWPYDDYHMIQKLYYENLLSAMNNNNNNNNSAAAKTTTTTPSNHQKKLLQQQQQQQQSNTNNSSIPIFSRPADPPDISTVVQGLSLTAFEATAEARAIAIVSTWLFDVGLIDELLVNGGMTGNYHRMMIQQHQQQQLPGSSSSNNNNGIDHTTTDDKSVQTTSEGVEIGMYGYPIEGSTKMDREIMKLRNSTRRQLALINARLNDGVTATGSEVQELVHAVVITKEDIGRLRELSTYVSNANDVADTTQFMLTKYPKLKQAINARRNLARCFRELDFFAQIPSTCERLREELHAGEWTVHEWSSLRSVAREHVELEIFLVEAEAGMKKRLQEEVSEMNNNNTGNNKKMNRRMSNIFGRNSFEQIGMGSNMATNNSLIDRFLEEHVQNVWELGDEIRLRLMSGISNAYDLAINNPAGMVALVEAVEVYELANADYKAVHGEEAGMLRNQKLRFTDMRAAALAELYRDFETRGLEVFRDLTTQAADIAEEGDDDVANKTFSAVLRASNELASEIGIVKGHMAPCFPPNWNIAVLWTTCVAHVCSTNILQQIGGPDGQKLPDLTVTQLLDLVAWVENFREIIQESFPQIGSISSKRTYLHQSPKLLQDNSKTIDIDLAQDSLAWVNNTLWDVHDLAKDEFLLRTTEQTEAWLDNVYDADHNKTQTADGRLVTSLCEDVYSLAGVQLRTIRERLTRRSEALVQAVGVIFKNLYEKQNKCREIFCVDFECCCAASNDFVRMSDKCEEIVSEIQDECELSPNSKETLEEQAAAIVGLYSSDAVYAAKKTHIYCFEPIEEAIANELFGTEWEVELTHNELSLTLVRTLDDFMEDLETFLDEVMVQKAVEAQIASAINFYIRCMLKKASTHNNNKKSCFADNEGAINRMRGDITVMREYFDGLAETMPTLERIIESEFSLLEAVIEILSIASGLSKSDARDFILIIQKRVRNVAITKFVIGDLYHLVQPAEERGVYELIDGMEEELAAIAPTDEEAATSANDRNTVPGLRTDEMMAKHCDDSKRNRPLKAGAMERAENALRGWRVNWGVGGNKQQQEQ